MDLTGDNAKFDSLGRLYAITDQVRSMSGKPNQIIQQWATMKTGNGRLIISYPSWQC